MQEVMRCIKNFIVCFVVFTMVFGLSFLMIFSGNFRNESGCYYYNMHVDR